MVCGVGDVDFNVVRFSHEKSPTSRKTRSVRLFDKFIRELELRDLALHNASFTWSHFREEPIKSRLDIFLFIEEWGVGKNDIRQEKESMTCSDHMPLILDMMSVSWGPTPFRFENMWLGHLDFRQKCENWWSGIGVKGWESYKIMEKLKVLKEKIKVWNKEVFGDTRIIKKEVVGKIVEIDKKKKGNLQLDDGDRELRSRLRNQLEKIVFKEMSAWSLGWWAFDEITWGRNSSERAVWLERPFEEEEIKKVVFDAQKIKDFRPISLVSGIYKILAKLLANRLREVLEETISLTQGAFVHNRHLLDMVLVATEAVEDYRKRRKRGGGGGCISLANFSIMINGKLRGRFGATRGLRQGDPLSPFLLIIVVDILGRLMDKVVRIGEVNGFKVGREEVVVSHLQFADDTFFLLEPEQNNIKKVNIILKFFSMCSGLKINMNKSSSAGINLEEEEVRVLAADVGCEKGSWPMKYLGLLLGGNLNSADFWNPTVEKVRKRLDG
ncbi:hypothetical protein UlMin_010840 [Ulmus minor]